MKSTQFFKRFKKDIKDKKEYKKALFFLFLFILFFSLFYLVFGKTPIANYINCFYGLVSSFILSILGISNSFVFDTATKSSTIFVSKLTEPITLGFLCTGILEFCLLASAIAASAGIVVKKRVFGVLLAIPIIFVFNTTRIVLTSLIILGGNLSFANFVHGLLFRLFLIIVIIGTYYFWFKANTR